MTVYYWFLKSIMQNLGRNEDLNGKDNEEKYDFLEEINDEESRSLDDSGDLDYVPSDNEVLSSENNDNDVAIGRGTTSDEESSTHHQTNGEADDEQEEDESEDDESDEEGDDDGVSFGEERYEGFDFFRVYRFESIELKNVGHCECCGNYGTYMDMCGCESCCFI